jgi:hypothetical protein
MLAIIAPSDVEMRFVESLPFLRDIVVCIVSVTWC